MIDAGEGTRPARRRGLPNMAWPVVAWPLVAWVVLIVIVLPLVARDLAPLDSEEATRPFGFLDFRDTVWVPIRDWLAGGVPWDTGSYLSRHPASQDFLLYVPSYFVVALPLVALPYRISAFVWVGVMAAALVWLTEASLRLFVTPRWRRAWLVVPVVLLLLATRPVRTAVSQGQWAMLSGAGAGLLLLRRGSASDGLAAMLALVKPPVALGVLLVQGALGRLRPLLRPWALSALLALPVAITVLVRMGGWEPTIAMVRASLGAGDGVVGGQRGANGPRRIDLWWIADPGLAAPWSTLVVLAAGAAVLAALAVLARRWGPRHPYPVCLAGLAMVLLVPNQLYAMVVLIPGLVAMVGQCLSDLGPRGDARPGRRRLVADVAVTGLLLVAMAVPGGVLTEARVHGLITAALIDALAILCYVGLVHRPPAPVGARPEGPPVADGSTFAAG